MNFYLSSGSKRHRSARISMSNHKSVVFILFLFLLNITSVAWSQDQKISLDMRNKTIKEVLMQIESQTAYRFIYENQAVSLDKKVNFQVKDQSVEQVLKQLLDKEGIKYSVTDSNMILINPAGPTGSSVILSENQGITISGTVVDYLGETLPGASIIVKGSTIGITTDMDGRYQITVPDRTSVLVISYLGYQSQEVTVGNKTLINVTMYEDSQMIDEVIVVGYGVQKKASAVGAITSIKSDQLITSSVANLSVGLAGQAPGLFAINRGGEPGNDGAALRIRGQNTMNNTDPLVVIDGVANRHGGLDRIDANDIESISVLKDASAAIYGAQAANGVILVTTRRGKSGKPQVKYSYNQGFAQATRFPKMADAATYATMMNELAEYSGNLPVYTPDEIQKFRDGSDPWLYPNTDWFGETMKKLSPQYKQSLSIDGGNENMQYYLALQTVGQDGYYKNSGTRYDLYNLKGNFDAKINDYISVGMGFTGREEVKHGLNQGTYYELLMTAKPTAVGYWPNGLPGPAVQGNTNPVIGASKDAGYKRTKLYYIQTDFKLEVKNPWIKELKFVGNFAYDKMIEVYKQFIKNMTTYNWDKISYDENGIPVLVPYVRGGDQADPDLRQSLNDRFNMVINGTLQYSKVFNMDHSVNVMLGMEGNKGVKDYFYARRRYYISDVIDELFAGGDKDKENDGNSSEYARVNYFGRFNYAYKNKYLFEFVGRYDGSYIFPGQSRYGFFPGFLVGWIPSEETFWKNNLPVVNYFKLRGSWGQTGNDRVDPYQFLSSFKYSGSNLVLGETIEEKALYSARIGNPNITWEIANQSNIAFESQLFDSKLTFGMDFFYNKRTKILVKRNASVPDYTGINLPDENIGKFENKGFEFDLGYRSNIGDLRYNVNINGGYARNKILFWDETPGVLPYQQSTGHPYESKLYYKALGVYKTQEEVDNSPHWPGARPGDVIFEDVNRDGEINADDRVRIDRTNIPRFTGGFTVNLEYKGLDLAMMFQGATGASQYVKSFSGQIGNYLKEDAEKRWTPENWTSDYPRAFNRDEEYWRSQQNTFFLRKTDYLRLKNLEIGYTIPRDVITKIGLKNLRVYVSGFNLLTFDKLKVYDPEGDTDTGQFYPQQRVFNVGASINF